MAARKIVALVNDLATWHPPDNAVQDLLRHRGRYTHMLFGSWTAAFPQDAARAWTDPATFPADSIDLLHKSGIRVMVSAGGHELPISEGRDPQRYAEALAAFADEYQFDGVDVAIDDPEGMASPGADNWLLALTQTLRRRLPHAILSHTAAARFFGPGEQGVYSRLNNQLNELVAFYIVRYFGHGGACYNNPEQVLCQAPTCAPGTALDQLIEAGWQADKLLIGTPITSEELGVEGCRHIHLHDLASQLRQRIQVGAPIAGLCGFSWAADRRVHCGEWSVEIGRALSEEC